MATWIRANGTRTQTEPENGKTFSLSEMQKYVGGYVEQVLVPNTERVFLVNEEGLLLDLPDNEIATGLCGRRIVGDVLICNFDQMSLKL